MTTAAAAAEPVTPPEWTFADRLRKVRRDVLDVDQGEFADRLSVSRKAYASWEMGRTKPRDILALAHTVEFVTGVAASWLLGFEAPEGSRGLHTVPGRNPFLYSVTGTTHRAVGHAATRLAQPAAA